jgi:hypothetical protein
VLEFADRPSWSLSIAEGRATVLLGPGDRRFDAGAVFSRIPRTRIRSVEATPEGLVLELGCDCSVTAFEVRDSALAIDVSDGATGPALRDVSTTASVGTEAEEIPAPPVVTAPPPLRAPLPTAEREAPVLQPPAVPPPSRPTLAELPPAPETDPGPMRPGAAEGPEGRVLSDLTEAIARATTQGNLRLAPVPREGAPAPPEALAADPGAGNLRLRLPGEEAWLTEEAPDGTDCQDGASYDVASWVPDDLSAAEAIAGFQAGLASDLDAIDEDQAVALARLYVGLGFGAEARAVLAALAPRHPDTALLEEMARIVDGAPPQGGILETEADCPGRAQLWVALTSGEAAKASDVIVAIGELPIALRRQLAPRVMSTLIARGDEPAAEAVRGTIERTEGPHGAPFALAAARMEAERAPDPDLATLRGLVGDRSPSSDEALAVLLEIARERASALDSGTLARAETRADDLRGTELGTRIGTGLIHAYLRAADFGRAAAWLSTIVETEALPPDGRAALAADFFSALTARGTDEDLLVQAARFEGPVSDLVRGEPAGIATAARLLDLGFSRLAERYLPEVPTAPDTLLLGARARLLAADPTGALALLEAVDPRAPDHSMLRAEAIRALGRAEEAPETPAPPAQPVPAEEAAEPDAPAVAGGTARALVQASEEARRQVDALLASAPSP